MPSSTSRSGAEQAIAAPQLDYPSHREADVVLRDGSTVHIRPIRPADENQLLRLLEGLSDQSRYFRFFGGGPNLPRLAADFADMNYRSRYGLVATAGPKQEIVAHALYMTTAPGRAEAAFEVQDAYQGRGVGSILLGQLAEYAASVGIDTFEASVLNANRKMLDVFRQSGFPLRTRMDDGLIFDEFPTAITAEAIASFESREQVGAIAAVQRFLKPRSVAVIGASRRRNTPAGQLFHNLAAGAFKGDVYPVNPKADSVQRVHAYPSVTDIPGPVDLAVVCVPAALVTGVARECAAKGVTAMVVVSAGFAESGGRGAELEAELLQVCRQSGMRMIGPNCLGIINTAADVSLHATFSDTRPIPGRIGFMSQSGALGISVLEHAAELGLGISSFVSAGNKADISGNDLLSYWESDPDTDLVLLYLESFGNPRKFARLAGRVGRTKPIIVVKGGRSRAGSRAAGSHTAALLSASDVTVDALFQQAGVIRTETLGEMFGVAQMLATQPVPRGRRVAILTNAGGPAILCADALEAAGLEVPPTPASLELELQKLAPPAAALSNPIDLLASAKPADFAKALTLVAGSGAYDAVIVLHIDIIKGQSRAVGEVVERAAARVGDAITLAAVLMSGGQVPGGRVPVYAFPEDAAIALAHAADYGRFRARPESPPPALANVDQTRAAEVIAGALERGETWLGPQDTGDLLAAYGIPVAAYALVANPRAAGRAAAAMGGPVALKAVAKGLVHKTEAAGVRLGLEGATRVAAAAHEMGLGLLKAGYNLDTFMVQQMVPGGTELLLGVVQDPAFGPILACGAGGTTAELIGDVKVALTPVTLDDADRLLRGLRTFPLLTGYRGSDAADIDAIKEVVVRLGALADRHPAIAELDLNPLVATHSGVLVVDARIRIAPPRRLPPVLARRQFPPVLV
jgi:acyl-CoA synthetase (NDP forming)/GNAT superfamily N-acetyltransferase